MNRKPLLFNLMLKQGIAWFTIVTETQENCVNINQALIYSQHFIPFPDGLYTAAQMELLAWIFLMPDYQWKL